MNYCDNRVGLNISTFVFKLYQTLDAQKAHVINSKSSMLINNPTCSLWIFSIFELLRPIICVEPSNCIQLINKYLYFSSMSRRCLNSHHYNNNAKFVIRIRRNDYLFLFHATIYHFNSRVTYKDLSSVCFICRCNFRVKLIYCTTNSD